MEKKVLVGVVLFVTLIFSGCNMSEDMTPCSFDIQGKLPFSVYIEPVILVDKKGDVLDTNCHTIESSWYTDAVIAGLKNSEIFNEVAEYQKDAGLLLKIKKFPSKTPIAILDCTGRETFNWQLLVASNRKVVWERRITADYTPPPILCATPEIGPHKAYTGAVKANIRKAIQQMSAIKPE